MSEHGYDARTFVFNPAGDIPIAAAMCTPIFIHVYETGQNFYGFVYVPVLD